MCSSEGFWRWQRSNGVYCDGLSGMDVERIIEYPVGEA